MNEPSNFVSQSLSICPSFMGRSANRRSPASSLVMTHILRLEATPQGRQQLDNLRENYQAGHASSSPLVLVARLLNLARETLPLTLGKPAKSSFSQRSPSRASSAARSRCDRLHAGGGGYPTAISSILGTPSTTE